MNKLMTVVAASVCAVSFSATAFAAAEAPAAENKANAEALEEKEDSILEAGLDIDLFSAYIWRNVVQTDKPVLQPCAWLDVSLTDWLWIGGFYWQGWDLSDDRRGADGDFRRRLNESDYNIHVGATAWENEDGDMNLEFEFGHEWYTYHFDNDVPSTRELYLKGKFSNPIVDVYGQVSWMYDDIGECNSGWFYECGFTKEVELSDSLTLGADWNVSFGNGDYLEFLVGDVNCVDVDNDDEYDVWEKPSGFAGTTLKAYLTWSITDWMSLTGTIAYTGLLNQDARDQYNADGARDDKDILWGGISAKFSF